MKYLGRNSLIDRLTYQVGGDRALALSILRKRGHVDEYGNLTEEGMKRDAMTAEERAIARARKQGRKGRLRYNPITNNVYSKK